MNFERNYNKKLLTDSSPFAISEAFKMLRTNMFYTSKGESCPIYGITSSFAHSGKSLIISNLAVSFAQLNKRVLLLDCDLRNAVQHRIFNIERGGGISELLAGSDNAIDKSLKGTQYPNLKIITAGGTPPNPAELLASDRMIKLIEFLKHHFDIIFIDMPPVGVVTDAAVMTGIVTGYVFIVRAGLDDYRSLKYSLATMEQMESNIVGIVLNDVDIKSGAYYGGKYSKYGKYGKYKRYSYFSKHKRYDYGYSRYGRYYGKYGKYGAGYGAGAGYGYGHTPKKEKK